MSPTRTPLPGAQMFRLRDGRRLAYNEWGDRRGKPVLYFHGLHSSRLALYRDPDFFAAHAIRFVTMDRPGIGQSDPQPHRTLLDWPADVAQLADALDLDRFAILAITGGGPYALACAYALPARLTGVAIVSGSGPMDEPSLALDGTMGHLLSLATRRPLALRALYAALLPILRRQTDRVAHIVAASFSEPDRRVAERPDVRRTQIAMFLEAFRHGARGEVQELAIAARPWGFRPEGITIPVQLWDGDQNTLMPPAHAQYLAHAIPNAHLTICPGEGHLLIVDHMAEIIQGIVA